MEGRTTTVSRTEDGEWTIVYHHADFAEMAANMGACGTDAWSASGLDGRSTFPNSDAARTIES